MKPEISDRGQGSPAQVTRDIPGAANATATTDSKTDPGGPHSAGMDVGNWTVLIVLPLLLAGAVVIGIVGWSLGSGAHVPASGYVAMALGVVFSLAVGFGLMGLIFYSSRRGYDDPPVLLPHQTSDGDRE
jgi:hypothetical protein